MTERVVDGQLSGYTLERLCASVEWRVFLMRRRIVEAKHRGLASVVQRIVSVPEPHEYVDSEMIFDRLQAQYPSRPEYGYDALSIWKRAASRASEILSLPGLHDQGRKVVEIGAGDGMVGRLLADYGHRVTLVDADDWRDARASGLSFMRSDVCRGLPIESESVDLVYSYNTFEHLWDPAGAFAEMARVCRAGGTMLLSFGPLYWSPWGLHAFSALNMPYPQMLFSSAFLEDKVAKLGISDLNRRMTELQPTNGWRPRQYVALWDRPDLDVLDEQFVEDYSHLGLAREYSQAFRGLLLGWRDLVTQGIRLVARKRS
ncbi:MAG: class I SAM-dependent methyltransferase [Anaerolineae bacterium]